MSTYLSLCKCIQDKHWHTYIYEWESTHTQISRETNSSLCFHVVKVGINAVRGFKVSVSSLCEIEMCVYSGVSAQLFSSVRLDLYLLSLYLVALFPWLEAVKSKSSYSTVKEKQKQKHFSCRFCWGFLFLRSIFHPEMTTTTSADTAFRRW